MNLISERQDESCMYHANGDYMCKTQMNVSNPTPHYVSCQGQSQKHIAETFFPGNIPMSRRGLVSMESIPKPAILGGSELYMDISK